MPGFLPATLPLPVDPRGYVGLSPLLFTAVSLTTRPASFGFSRKRNPQIRGTRESEIDQKGKTAERTLRSRVWLAPPGHSREECRQATQS